MITLSLLCYINYLILYWLGLVLLYMANMEESLSGRNDNQHIIKDVNTLRSLLEKPPGDFPDNLRDDIVKGFVRIFSCIR